MLQNSTSGFGTVSVSGRRRVPKPPTRISALSEEPLAAAEGAAAEDMEAVSARETASTEQCS